MRRRQPSSPLFPYTTLFRSLFARVRARDSSGNLLGNLLGLVWNDSHSLFVSKRLPFCVQTAPFFRRNRSEEHTSELQSRRDLVCRLLLEKNKQFYPHSRYQS